MPSINSDAVDKFREVFERLGSPLSTASDEVTAAAIADGTMKFADLCDHFAPLWEISDNVIHASEVLHAMGDMFEIVEKYAVQD